MPLHRGFGLREECVVPLYRGYRLRGECVVLREDSLGFGEDRGGVYSVVRRVYDRDEFRRETNNKNGGFEGVQRRGRDSLHWKRPDEVQVVEEVGECTSEPDGEARDAGGWTWISVDGAD